MPKPIIFLAFANDKQDNARYLRNLANELRGLEVIFQDKPCDLVIKTSATIEDIFDVFRRNQDKIAIFHYGGHADGYHLLLETLTAVANPVNGLQDTVEKRLLASATANSIAYGEGLTAFLGNQKICNWHFSMAVPHVSLQTN